MTNTRNNRRPKPRKGAGTDVAFDPVETALRQLYDKVAAEDIPDDFLKLLDDLEGDGSKQEPD